MQNAARFRDRRLPDLYRRLYAGLSRREEKIAIPLSPTEQVSLALRLVLAEHPELVWFAGGWSGHSPETEIVCPRYELEPEQIRVFQAFEQELGERLQTSLPESAPACVRTLAQWMTGQIRYEPKSARGQTAFGALIERRAACRGIAKACQLILRRAGIDTLLVEGTLDGRVPHVWDQVKIGENYLHVDMTLGLPCFSGPGAPYEGREFLLVSDKALRLTHRWQTGEAIERDAYVRQYC